MTRETDSGESTEEERQHPCDELSGKIIPICEEYDSYTVCAVGMIMVYTALSMMPEASKRAGINLVRESMDAVAAGKEEGLFQANRLQ